MTLPMETQYGNRPEEEATAARVRYWAALAHCTVPVKINMVTSSTAVRRLVKRFMEQNPFLSV